MRTFAFILVFLSFAGICSAQAKYTGSKLVMEEVFDDKELYTYNRIIDFYDDFVLSHFDKGKPIDKAYRKFASHYFPICEQQGDLSLMKPSDSLFIPFLKSLDKEAFNEMYFVRDSIKIFDSILSVPYHFNLNVYGKYVQFVKRLSERNYLFKKFYSDYTSAGDVSPTTLVWLMFDHNKINFSSRDERLVFISVFMFTNPMPENYETPIKIHFNRSKEQKDH